MRKSLFYGASKICFPRMVKRDRFGRFVVDPSDYGMTPSYMKRVENQYEKSMQTGRSMLEVMFVVGLMTVISLGGIKGYEIITNKAKARSVANLVSTLVKERQARSLSLSEGKSDIQKVKIGDKEILVQNGTPQDGDKEPFFWVDVDFDKKAECKEFLYTDFIQPAFMAVDNSIPGECPGKVRLYFPKDPQDNTNGIKTYVNPSDGKIYICEGDDCSSAGGNSYSLACRTGHTPNKDKTKCEKITCSTYHGTGFANEYYAGGFVGFANDGVTRCYCPTGQTFEVDQCITSTSECSGHGSNSSGLCSCLAGYCGNNCENRVTCFNAGIWTEHGCNCAEGWAGTYCDEPASNNCSNHGVYQGNRCFCNEGYYGAVCEYYNDCSGNGRVNPDGTCTCNDGYYGTDCENRENTDSCNGHGIDSGSGCVCNEGYYGTYCESYNDCSGNGKVDSNGTCTCNSDYYGADCEYYNNCSGNGQVDSNGTCTCNEGYYGTDCEDEYCSGHGTLCGGYCSCDDGWYGTYCESEGASDPCNGHGTLDWAGANRWSEYPNLCLCDDWYGGGDCLHDFYESLYTPHGRRLGIDGIGAYVCDVGYFGALCEKTSSSVCSGKGHYIVIQERDMGCLCNDGTIEEGDAIFGNLCATSGAYDVCSGHGEYAWLPAPWLFGGTGGFCGYGCICSKGYQGVSGTLQGDYYPACMNYNADTCSGHGRMMVYTGTDPYADGGPTCLCDTGYGNLKGAATECVSCASLYRESRTDNWPYPASGCGDCINGYTELSSNHDSELTGPCIKTCRSNNDCSGGEFCAQKPNEVGACLNVPSHTTQADQAGRGTLYHYNTSSLSFPSIVYGADCRHDQTIQNLCSVEGLYPVSSSMLGCSITPWTCDFSRDIEGLVTGGLTGNGQDSVRGSSGPYRRPCDYNLGILCSDMKLCTGNGDCNSNEHCNGDAATGGTCVCNPGYYGPYCLSNPCNSRGTWQEDGAYCACDAGYYGTYCENGGAYDICNDHGTWVEAGGHCACDAGYYGTYCEKVRCFGHGTWQEDGGYCACDAGYCGAYCESEGNCSGHGTWNGSSCTCDTGYYGAYCENGGAYDPCNGHGTLDWPGAHSSNLLGATWGAADGGFCLCDKGYYGAEGDGTIASRQCSLAEQEYTAGSNYTVGSNRFCYDHGQWGGFGCVCDTGYYGISWKEGYCNVVGISNEICNGNGRALISEFEESYNNNRRGCLCNDGTIQEGDPINGNLCANSAQVCSGHGTLNWAGANYWPRHSDVCLCNKGYYGTDCSASRSSCNNHGQYSAVGCLCDSGYHGSECDAMEDLCNGNGQYIAFGFDYNNGSCLCNNGIIQTGDSACAPSSCNGHGKWCGSGCSCFDGWMGDDCNTETSSACNNHGTLNWPGANYLSGYYSNACLCAENYVGHHCESTGGTTCNGHGFWTDFCGCLCDSGYCGNSCQNVNASVCYGKGQYISSWVFTGCLCDDNTFQTGVNACIGPCNGHGTLNWPGRNYFVYTDLCLCDEGYHQGGGSIVDAQCASTCSVDWTCCHHNGRRVVCGCLCDAGYCGSYCKTRNSAACDGRGQFYYAEDGTGTGCFCDDGTFETGDDACKIHDCSGHGSWCGSFCSCDSNWYGKDCSYDDSREPCSGNGYWCGSSCICDEGWAGELCNKSSACSGHGILSWPGRNYFSGHSDVCLCDQGYGALNCSIYVSEYQTKGNYIGVSDNSMYGAYVCFAGYCGSYCDKAGNPCNGKGRAMVGYSNSSVTSFGCLCDDGTIQTGDGACASTSTECSGHGTKTNGTCVCNSGYTGTNCETECSGNGTRNKDGSCACNDGYCGTNCENVRSDSDCGFKIENNCYSCSYLGETGGFNWESSKTECDKCSNREIYTDFYGNKTCALSATSCYASYQEGGFRGRCGAACLSCSVTEPVETFAADCRKCSNREMTTSEYYKYCVLTSAACHSRYPEGGFRRNDGWCFSCSYENGIYDTSTTECKKCSNREMLDDSCVLTTAACNALYPEGGVRDDWGACYSCSYEYSIYNISKDECDKCGNLRYHDGTYCRKK